MADAPLHRVSRFVLDTNAVIFLTARGNTISSALQDDLNNAALFINAITEIELFAKPEMLFGEEEKLRAFILDMTPVVDLTGAVKKETIALRRAAKLKLPDCIAAAASIALNAVLLSADKELLSLDWSGYAVKDLIAYAALSLCTLYSIDLFENISGRFREQAAP